MVDFLSLDYLEQGNPRQRLAFQELQSLCIMHSLAPYQPVLAGTIPIGIDIQDSDLDVICHAPDLEEFRSVLTQHYCHKKGFITRNGSTREGPYIFAHFEGQHFPIEIFGQSLPVVQQNAYRHMLIEHRLLQGKGDELCRQIIALKESGMKTEPAFAHLLGLKGDPYEALLALDHGNGAGDDHGKMT